MGFPPTDPEPEASEMATWGLAGSASRRSAAGFSRTKPPRPHPDGIFHQREAS